MRPLPPAQRFETNTITLATEDGVVTEVLLTYVPSSLGDAQEIREMVTAEGEINMRIPLADVDMVCAALQEAKERVTRTNDPPSSVDCSHTNEV